MTRLITFADDNMTMAAEICHYSALENNVHEAKMYGPKDIDAKFYKANKAILDTPRGSGLWLWKPYLIDRELKNMNDNDVLVYCDAGVEIVNNINHIVDRMTSDIWLFGNMWQHVHFCKADTFIPILSNQYYNYQGKQCQASVIIIRKTVYSSLFVHDWLKWCCIPGVIDDSPSKLPNHTEFKDHRHDQAVITCLAIRHNIPLHWWPAMYNAGHFTYEKTGYTDTYPVLFHHHRMRNNDFSATDDLGRHMQKYFKSKYSFA